MMKPHYHINVFYSAGDKCYIADIPDLKYCSAHGETPEKAVREVLVAQELWLESARCGKKRVPPPRYRPASHALT